LIHSATAFQIYLGSLINTGQRASISPAVRRRDNILAEFPESTSSAQNPTSPASVLPSKGTSEAALATGETPRPSSQDIAQGVLAGQADLVTSPSPTSSPDLTKFTAAFEANGSTSPIQVSIVERMFSRLLNILHTLIFFFTGKGAWVPRIIRFVSLVLVSSFCTVNLQTHSLVPDSFFVFISLPCHFVRFL